MKSRLLRIIVGISTVPIVSAFVLLSIAMGVIGSLSLLELVPGMHPAARDPLSEEMFAMPAFSVLVGIAGSYLLAVVIHTWIFFRIGPSTALGMFLKSYGPTIAAGLVLVITGAAAHKLLSALLVAAATCSLGGFVFLVFRAIRTRRSVK